ncbi:MAG: DUF4158 domain-containing protein [Streptosporangiaceae bacterium]
MIAARRRDCNRLGFALQVVTVRQLGMFLAGPLGVPPELIDYLAGQLGIEDSWCVKQYTEREKTKLEHAWEIQREYGLTPYADVESELAARVADQAWMTGDGPKAMFAGESPARRASGRDEREPGRTLPYDQPVRRRVAGTPGCRPATRRRPRSRAPPDLPTG